MKSLLISIFSVLLFSFSACIKRVENDSPAMSQEEIKSHLMRANKLVAHTESDAINDYISSKGLHMQSSGTGLRYAITGNPSGKKPRKDGRVAIAFGIELTDETPCYHIGKENPLVFTLGKGEQCNGIEEAILMMSEGQKSKLIVPSHLGYGLAGDQNKIPPKAVLVIDLELIKVY